ncbi:MAG: hypothetical protein ACFHWX_12905 [Bacteroidota bacterium]
MKKLVIAIGLFLSVGFYTQAQNHLEGGLRFGGGFNNNIALDFTVPLAAKPRLHPAMYFNNNGVTLGAYFDWLFTVNDAPGLRLYPGVGPELYLYNNAELALAGNFGIEYAFDIPLTVGFDWRPSILLTEGGPLGTNNWGIIVRYRFK